MSNKFTVNHFRKITIADVDSVEELSAGLDHALLKIPAGEISVKFGRSVKTRIRARATFDRVFPLSVVAEVARNYLRGGWGYCNIALAVDQQYTYIITLVDERE